MATLTPTMSGVPTELYHSPDLGVFGGIAHHVILNGDVNVGSNVSMNSYGALRVLFILITYTVSIHPVLFITVDGEMI